MAVFLITYDIASGDKRADLLNAINQIFNDHIELSESTYAINVDGTLSPQAILAVFQRDCLDHGHSIGTITIAQMSSPFDTWINPPNPTIESWLKKRLAQ